MSRPSHFRATRTGCTGHAAATAARQPSRRRHGAAPRFPGIEKRTRAAAAARLQKSLWHQALAMAAPARARLARTLHPSCVGAWVPRKLQEKPLQSLQLALGVRSADAALERAVERAGIRCELFHTTAALREASLSRRFDGVLIDGAGGLDWRPFVDSRRGWVVRPMFVVVAGAPSDLAAAALEAGADDFVALPAAPSELLARLQHARRRHAPVAGTQRSGDVELDAARSCLRGPQGEVALTAREAALAERLFSLAGGVASRRGLAEQIWHCDESVAARAIEQHIYQLRRKLSRCGAGAPVVRSVYGGGYRLEPQLSGDAA